VEVVDSGGVSTGGEVIAERVAAEEEREINIRFGEAGSPGSYDAVFTNRGARLLRLSLGDYFKTQDLNEEGRADVANWVELTSSVESHQGATGSLALIADTSAAALITEPLEKALWNARELESGGIEFTYAPGTGVRFIKRILPDPGRPQFRVELEIVNENAPGLAGKAQFRLTPADVVRPIGEERFYQEPQALVVWRDRDGELVAEDAIASTGGSDLAGPLPRPGGGTFSFGGVHNKFFAFLMRPADPGSGASVIGAAYHRVQDRGWLAENPEETEGDAWKYVVADLALQLDIPEPGAKKTWAFDVYAGPKQRDRLTEVHPDYAAMIDEDVGFFAGIARIIVAIMSFYSGLVGNWGWGIILMTFTVRAVLFPLNRRAQTAMARYAKKMKRVQPRINEVKEKYQNNPKKLREEQSRIMQEEGAFPPLGGCLPMFLQFPVFIGLFQALRVDFNLRQQPFMLWMKDLSQPDQLLELNFNTHLPFVGTIEYLNILPILMVGLWITQHKVMPQPTAADANAERTRKMMIVMQVFFAFLFYSYASGLALYMITSSTIAIFETVVIKKVWPIDDAEVEKKKKKPGRFMQKVADMQKDQLRRVEDDKRKRGAAKKKRKKK
jgi:YidC/Oxa1 family membrane protein insertase